MDAQVSEVATRLGIDPVYDTDLLYIAEEFLLTPLPRKSRVPSFPLSSFTTLALPRFVSRPLLTARLFADTNEPTFLLLWWPVCHTHTYTHSGLDGIQQRRWSHLLLQRAKENDTGENKGRRHQRRPWRPPFASSLLTRFATNANFIFSVGPPPRGLLQRHRLYAKDWLQLAGAENAGAPSYPGRNERDGKVL